MPYYYFYHAMMCIIILWLLRYPHFRGILCLALDAHGSTIVSQVINRPWVPKHNLWFRPAWAVTWYVYVNNCVHYISMEAATLIPWNVVHGCLPGGGRLPRTLRYVVWMASGIWVLTCTCSFSIVAMLFVYDHTIVQHTTQPRNALWCRNQLRLITLKYHSCHIENALLWRVQ